MKKIIQQYTTPLAPQSIIDLALKNVNKKTKRYNLLIFIFPSLSFVLFVQNFIEFNMSYSDIFISAGGGINIWILAFLNIALSIIYFTIKQPLIIPTIFLIYMIANLYIFSQKQ